MSVIRWSEKYNVPLLPKNPTEKKHIGGIASDVRPVFPEERHLMEILLRLTPGQLANASVWATSSSRLIIDGQVVAINKSDFMNRDPSEIRRALCEIDHSSREEQWCSEWLRVFGLCNKQRMDAMEEYALQIVKEGDKRVPGAFPFISFSGGKDSTVVSDIVRRVLGNSKVLHVFGDTTLELPTTYAYIKRFQENNRKIPFIKTRSKHDFQDLCQRIGPPSRVMRWCCTVFKTGPIARKLGALGKPHYLTFYGVRRSESVRRSSYEAISESPKVSSQTVVAPIIDWWDADLWTYVINRALDFNDTYRYGFTRVGCWCCPSNSMWSAFLTRVFFPELSEPWREFLVQFASSMGKPDPEVYVDTGKWKARQGGIGVSTARDSLISSRVCGDDPNARVFSLSRPINQSLYEYFKPFGEIDHSSGKSRTNEVLVVDSSTRQPILSLQGAIGSTELRVAVMKSADPTLMLHRVDCQVRKFQSCILCGGCLSACPNGAIEFKRDSYHIDQNRCVHCLRCVNHFDTGCLVSKVLQVKRGSDI